MNSTRSAAIVAVMAFVLVLAAVSFSAADTYVASTGDDNQETPVTSEATAWDEAHGTCGTGTSASWSVDKGTGVLEITGTGGVSLLTSSASSWAGSGWTLAGITNDTPQTNADKDVLPSDVFSTVESVVINTSGTVAAKALNSLSATSVSFGANHKTIETGLFEDNTTITTISFTNVTTIGDSAFKGCTKIASITIPSSVTQLSHTAFDGCTAVKKISVDSGNTAYASDDAGFVYTKGYSTLYMAPPGMTGNVTSVNKAVRTICLDYADVNYIINLDTLTSMDVTFQELTGARAIGVAYSMQSISNTPTATINNDTFTLTYTLYSGWTSNASIAVVEGGTVSSASETSMSFTVAAGSGYKAYPVGKAMITYNDLYSISDEGLNGWKVGDVDLKAECDSFGRVTVISSYTCAVNGYDGDGYAHLGTEIMNWGASCKVTSVNPGDYRALVTLYINGSGDLDISGGVFQNLPELESVQTEGVSEISPQMFRYCTVLSLVELENCSEIGEYAFEGCTNLKSIEITFTVASPKLAIGDGAFSNSGMEVVQTGTDVTISGDSRDALIVYCDEFVNLRMSGDNLIIENREYNTYTYSTSLTGQTQSGQFYSGGLASIYTQGMDHIYLSVSASGTASSQCLIVLESQMGYHIDSMVVNVGDKLTLPTPTQDGYIFMGWALEGGDAVASGSTVSDSMVLEAQWQKENTPDNTAVFVLALFVVAVVATVAILFVNSRR